MRLICALIVVPDFFIRSLLADMILAVALPGLLPGLLPAVKTASVVVRAAAPADVRCAPVSFPPLIAKVGDLCADCLFEPESQKDRQQLSHEMSRNILSRFTPLNERPNALIIAEVHVQGQRQVVGSCGIEAAPVTPEGRLSAKLSTDAQRMVVRPLLSNLVVDPEYRRQGIATRLMHEAETLARSWHFDELLIKVESENVIARALYEQLGFQAVAVDALAEKPQPGVDRVLWVRTSNIVLRKELPSGVPAVWSLQNFGGVVVQKLRGAVAQ